MKMRIIIEYDTNNRKEFGEAVKRALNSAQYDMPGIAELEYLATEVIEDINATSGTTVLVSP